VLMRASLDARRYRQIVRGTDRHEHGPAPGADARWLSGALALILAFMIGEVVAGLAAHSLALISDAAHMLTDAASIALVLVTARLAARPPAGGYTYGLKRTEIMSAQANGITLVLLAVWLGYSAIRRLVTPAAVAGGTVLGVALAGIAVNLAAALLIARAGSHGHPERTAGQPGERNETGNSPPSGVLKAGFHDMRTEPQSLNLAGAFRHIVTDLYAFAATAVAGLIIVLTGFARADAIATLVVVALMLHAGADLIRKSGRIFLEAAPAGLSPAAVGTAMAARPNVSEVHDLHIWEITSGLPAASAHVLVAPGSDCHAVRADLEAFLSRQYGITHATLQVDHAAAPDGRQNGSGPGPAGLPAAETHCDDAHGPVYRPGDG
jgi:cobalt-zinc-cadmium efflux system protein